MALTLRVQQQLERVGLTDFFNATKDKVWLTLAQRSYTFVEQNFPDNTTIRPDDVAQALLPLVNVNEQLTDVLAEKKLKQQYWREYFCDLIIDRCWYQISRTEQS